MNEEIDKLGSSAETIFTKATKDIIEDQIKCGIVIITDGEVRRENYIHYHCRHINGIDFNHLTKICRTIFCYSKDIFFYFRFRIV